MSTVAILQSNYIPWKGYFDLIAAVDDFVVYDCVQYTKNDWRNRNRIKAPGGGTRWITVPVRRHSLGQRIDETAVADTEILRRHWSTITQTYAKAPAYQQMREHVEPLFDRPAPERLSELNVDLIRAFCALLGITTTIRHCDEFTLGEDRTGRLVEICRQVGADCYLSGPSARDYLDEERFSASGIAVEWMSYAGYPEYPQPHPPFDHHVSIVDLVLCTGDDAPEYLLHAGHDTGRHRARRARR
jgi:hypothetical protein